MQKFVGKWHAANSFLQFLYYFHNWSDVWSSYRSGKTLPPLTLRKDREFWQIVKRVVFEYHDCFRSGCKERVIKVLTEQGFTQIKTALLSPLDGLGVIQASR